MRLPTLWLHNEPSATESFLTIHQVHFYKPRYFVFAQLEFVTSWIFVTYKNCKIWIRNSELNFEIASNSTLYSVPFLDQVFARWDQSHYEIA